MAETTKNSIPLWLRNSWDNTNNLYQMENGWADTPYFSDTYRGSPTYNNKQWPSWYKPMIKLQPKNYEETPYNAKSDYMMASLAGVDPLMYHNIKNAQRLKLTLNKQEPTAETYGSTESRTYLTPKKKDNSDTIAGSSFLAKAVLAGANTLMNLRNIDKAHDIARRKIVPPVRAALVPVQQVEGLPLEVMNARKQDIASIISQYNGSDAVLDTISKQLAESEKFKAKNQLAAEEAAAIQASKKENLKGRQANAMANVEAINKQSLLNAQEEARIRDVADLGALTSRNAVLTKMFNAGTEAIDNVRDYMTEKNMREVENTRRQLVSQINTQMMIANTNGVTPQERTRAIEEAKRLSGEIDKLNYNLPSYFGLYRSRSAANGGKLIAKS